MAKILNAGSERYVREYNELFVQEGDTLHLLSIDGSAQRDE